jgi:osmotically-inducible protein OsmY
MKSRILVLFLVMATAIVAVPSRSLGYQSERDRQRESRRDVAREQREERREVREQREDRDHDSQSDRDLPERDEINQTFELSNGARVEVSGINGTVEIQTSNSNSAEVHIVRSANNRADLEFHKIVIERTANRLVVRGEKENERKWNGRGHELRQRVMMKIPRQVDLTASGINGRATVGAIDGPVKLSGINGKVDVEQARGYTDISGINGRVSVTIAGLGERGIHVSGINGGVELRFAEDLNADLDVSGVNGAVNTDVSNVTIQGKLDRSNFKAKIGEGGSPISISAVNGRVRLSRVGASG